MNKKELRLRAMERSRDWWYCENMLHHPEQVGLLRMSFPQVFILIRDYGDAYFSNFEEFRGHVAEVNFLDPSERGKADLEEICVDAWNFLRLSEEYDETAYNQLTNPIINDGEEP